jgi:transcriptional regulator with XRE-family HTH domain
MNAAWFRYRLRELREANGLTQQELAHRAGMTREDIAQLEMGRQAEPVWSAVVALCKGLGVTADAFLREPAEPPAAAPNTTARTDTAPAAASHADPALGRTFEHTATDPFFAGHRLAELRRQQGITPEEQAAALGMGLPALALLCLCRQPRDMADVDMIAARMGWEAGRMADLLGVREGE